jgi:NADPH-dependent ferric siderophore reductase
MTETTKPGQYRMQDIAFRRIEVKTVQHLAPAYIRVTFTGDDLATFASYAATDHMKVIFWKRPEDAGIVPGPGWSLPEGVEKPDVRDYTPRRFDPDTRELDIEFVIHGSGPASTWAAQAAPGQQLAIAGPRGSFILDQSFGTWVTIGDETSLPGIARTLEEAPASQTIHAIVEVAGPEAEIPLRHGPNATVTWAHRAPGALEAAVRAATIPHDDVYVWASGEANDLRGIRRYLRDEVGIPTDYLNVSGHWKRGTGNWDHHEPIED